MGFPAKWKSHDCFREAEISYHTRQSWKDGYFQSAAIGQEFVIKDNEEIEKWVVYLNQVYILIFNE
jgi:hypothetical protein